MPQRQVRALGLPDTGATRSIVSTRFLKTRNIPFQDKANVQKLINASGQLMNSRGEIVLIIIANGRLCTTNAIISNDCVHDIIIAWHDLVDLECISPFFPYSKPPTNASAPNDPVSPSYNAEVHTADGIIQDNMKKKLKQQFKETVKNDIDKKPMKAEPLKIFLTDDAVPRRCLTVRQTPIHMQEEAEKLVQSLLDANIIKRVSDNEPTPWVAPGFFVPKPNGKGVRLVTDYRAINKFIRRPIHPFPSARDCLKKIPHTAKVFAKLDCLHGYFQLALDKESSYLTTFLLPSGRYRYVRAPMGLSASSDGFCFASDVMLEGLPFAVKIVDDILIWAETYNELFIRIEKVLKRCQKFNVTVSEKKMEIGQEINFAGYTVSNRGFKPDPSQVDGIRQFPVPTSVTELRSFLGLANQIAWFVPDLTHATVKMRELLKKDRAFMWQPEHTAEFNLAKHILTSPIVVKPFTPYKKTVLLTDASRLQGLGYALMQEDNTGRRHLICCGSTSLTDTQKNYATVELEALAIMYAIEKCSFYLTGLPEFEVWSDHRPLAGVFKKDMDATVNPRLATIRERLSSFNFVVRHIAGKNNAIADALSRAPVFQHDTTLAAAAACTTAADPMLDPMCEAAKIDSEYQWTLTTVLQNGKLAAAPKTHLAHQLKTCSDRISIYHNGDSKLLTLDATRIIVPLKYRKQLLKMLHTAHLGITKTRVLANQLYYWPGMNSDIENAIKSCEACRSRLPAQASVPNATYDLSKIEPMEELGADLGQQGKYDYLIVVDRASGYPFPFRITSQSTDAVKDKLRHLFLNYGFPKRIRTDGGPCFASANFANFCKENGIIHELSSAYNPASNGLAESAVKNMKALIGKCQDSKEDFEHALLEWRNAPRADGYSPAQVFFRRTPRTAMPKVGGAKVDPSQAKIGRQKALDATVKKFHQSSQPQPTLEPGQRVRIQDANNRRWTLKGVIAERRANGLSYMVKLDNGAQALRNRKFIRSEQEQAQQEEREEQLQPSPPTDAGPRRSVRIAQRLSPSTSLQ